MRERSDVPVVVAFAALLLAASAAFGQSIVSVRSGAVHYVEGRVLMDGQPLDLKFAQFPNLAEDGVLRTELGRAEMLLTPGTIFR